MKKMLALITAICMLLSTAFAAYGEHEHELMKMANLSIGDRVLEEWHGEKGSCTVVWDNLKLSDTDAAEFPKLAELFSELNSAAMQDANAEFSNLNETLESVDWPGEMFFEISSHIFPQRADTRAVSYLEEIYSFEGGAHPNYGYKGYTFDPQSGETIALTDVLGDCSDLPELLEKKITEKYDEVFFSDLSETFSEYKPEDFSWTIDYQGVTFWFSPYEIASFAVGLLSAKIWFSELDTFNSAYTAAPSGTYALMLPTDVELEFNLDEMDGTTDVIFAGQIPDQTGSQQMLTADVNGARYTDGINYAYKFDKFLVHTKSGNYLYTVSYSDGNSNEFIVLEVGDIVSELLRLKRTQFDSESVGTTADDFVVYRPFFNDPSEFVLSTQVELWGTRDGLVRYCTNPDTGLPERSDAPMNIKNEHSVVSKVPLEARVLPDLEWVTVPAGTEFSPFETDCETYVDSTLPDGRTVRLNADVSVWPVKINGMNEEDCFENLLYAG